MTSPLTQFSEADKRKYFNSFLFWRRKNKLLHDEAMMLYEKIKDPAPPFNSLREDMKQAEKLIHDKYFPLI